MYFVYVSQYLGRGVVYTHYKRVNVLPSDDAAARVLVVVVIEIVLLLPPVVSMPFQ